MCSIVRLVVQVKLLPTREQATALEATLRAVNAAACQVSRQAHALRTFRNYDLPRLQGGPGRGRRDLRRSGFHLPAVLLMWACGPQEPARSSLFLVYVVRLR
jgi:hypothetical protein